MSIDKVGTIVNEDDDEIVFEGWIIDQTDGEPITLNQLIEVSDTFKGIPPIDETPHFGEVDESVPDDGATEVFVPADPDEPPVQIETVPIKGTPSVEGRVAGRRPNSGGQIDRPAKVIVQEPAGSPETVPHPEVVQEDAAPLTDEVVANVADPQDVRPMSNAARRARGRW